MTKQITVALTFALWLTVGDAAFGATLPVYVNDIFFDDFVQPAGSLTTSDPNYDQVLGTVTLDGTTLASTSASGGPSSTNGPRSRLLDFSSSPDEWIASARFRVDGTLDTTSTRQYHLLSGTNSPTPLGTDNWEVLGIDLRIEEVAGDTGGTGSTFNLTWFGWDNINQNRVAAAVAGGSGLNKNQFYTLEAYRTPSDMVEMYLDGSLIDTKPLIVGTGGGSNPGQENPFRLEFGDFSGLIAADVTLDYLAIGSPIAVPEPSAAALLALGSVVIVRRRPRSGKERHQRADQ